jgi:hypothetical protein
MHIGKQLNTITVGVECRLIESKPDVKNSIPAIVFIILIFLWLLGPSIFTITNLNYTIASLVWILQYNQLWSVVSYGSIIPASGGSILHLPRFFFLLYVVTKLGKNTEFKVTLSFGILAELPFILGAVYYALFPPIAYAYYLTIPIPIVTIIGILLLMWKQPSQ